MRYQLERWRLRQVVPRPRAAEETALPVDYAIAQFRMSDGVSSVGVKSKRGRVCIVPSESVWCRLVCGPMVLGVKDGGLLPERAVQIERNDLTMPVGESVRKHVGDPRPNTMPGRRPLIR